MLRFLTAGESHGPGLVAIVEGLPAGLRIDIEFINGELIQRQKGAGRGNRMKIESDSVQVLSGLRFGKTLGSPLCLMITNKDWANWQEVMSPLPVPEMPRPLREPRPGHADLAGVLKYGLSDCRDILERASARETACRVSVGAVAKEFLARFGITVGSQVIQIGPIASETMLQHPDQAREVRESSVHTLDSNAAEKMVEAIEEARVHGESLGGVFEVVAWGVPPGLGSHVHWDRRLDSQLAGIIMGIPAIKGIQFGDGFELAHRPGSLAHDPIYYHASRGYYRESNNAGGVEGGISNGMPIRFSAAMKPIPTLMSPLPSVDIQTKAPVAASRERSDVCAVPAAAIVAEAMTAWVLAQAVVEKFGGDNIEEVLAAFTRYIRGLKPDDPE